MPSGRIHDRITYCCLPFVVAPAILITRSPTLTAVTSLSFLVGGLMLGPDLDIHSVQYTRWGPLRWIWLPYQIAIKHRSRLSHGPVIGTLLRVIYLAVWLALFTFIGIQLLNLLWDAQLSWSTLRDPFRAVFRRYAAEWVAILIGLEIGAASHFISDELGSHLVSRKRGRKKGAKRSADRNRKKRRRKR
ncbi:MAG: metal-binding protein [Phormidesmis sp.]